MRERERTPTDVAVTRVDLSSVNARLTVEYREGGDDRGGTTIRIHDDVGFVETSAGTFILDTEGVATGPFFDQETVRFYGYQHTERSFAVMPSMVEIPTVAEVKELATGDPVNLADFVRTFGARLERNYDLVREEIERAA